MGVKGLWSLLEPLLKTIPYSRLKNCKIAIDFSIWLYRLRSSITKSNNEYPNLAILKIFFNRLCELKIAGIKPIFVFDGRPLDLKRKVLYNRTISREESKKNAENIKKTITQNALYEYAVNQPEKPALEALKKVNLIEDSSENIKIDESKIIQPCDNFYRPHDLQHIDIESEEFEKLTSTEKIEYLTFLHDSVKYNFDRHSSFDEFSRHQVNKFILLGKINKKLDDISIRAAQSLKRKALADRDSHVFKHNPIFSNPNQYYLFLKKSGLIASNDIPPTTEANIPSINPNIKFNLLSYQHRKKTSIPLTTIQLRPLSPSSSSESEPLNKSESIIPLKLPVLLTIENKSQSEVPQSPQYLKSQSLLPIEPVTPPPVPLKKEDKIYTEKEAKITTDAINNLITEFGKTHSQGLSIPKELFAECCCLISLFGMAFLVAPCEAEAQCAALHKLGLCDMVSSEDSDSFLFGGTKIIRNLFKKTKRKSELQSNQVDLCEMSDISRILGLDRDDLICMGILSGCDYFDGIKGIGMSTAYKIALKFRDKNIHQTLKNFAHNYGSINRKLKIPQSFPPDLVIKSFENPIVDENPNQFIWKEVNYGLLGEYLRTKLSLSEINIESCIKELKKHKYDDEPYVEDFTKLDDGILKIYPPQIQQTRSKFGH